MVNRIKFFNYPLQFKLYEDKYLDIVKDVFSRGAYILGEDLERFENDFSKFVGSKFAIGVSNCTDALLLSLSAAGVGPGDEVISVSHTFVATIEVIKFLGATPIFVDIDGHHNMDVDLVESAITPKTRAIMPVHLNGRICNDMNKLVDIADKHNLVIIEDAAQSLGAKCRGKNAGTFGLAGCFSFYPAKLLGTFGDAGAIVTDDVEYANRLRMLRNHGRGNGTDINIWGLNCRMDNLHAAILSYKLGLLPEWIGRRREIARMYTEGLHDVKELKLPFFPKGENEHFDVFQNYEIEVENKGEFIEYLNKNGIDVNLPWGGKAVHQFESLGFGQVDLPRTEELFERCLMLPMYPELINEDVKFILDTIRCFYEK